MSDNEEFSPRVAVVGSLVFDIAVRLDRMPSTHETVLAHEVMTNAGGKGLCQAVAARRLGATVSVVGRIGNDVFGDFLLEILEAEGVDYENVTRDDSGTHLGIPLLTSDGNNRIIGIPRSSRNVSPADVDAAVPMLSTADLLLLQGETPLPAIRSAIAAAGHDTLVMWNPAPATFTLEEMLNWDDGMKVDWLTPNEIEATELTGITVCTPESAFSAAREIHRRYPHVGVVVTLGEQGAIAVDRSGMEYTAAPMSVIAVDPTAAGDVFTAAFGVSLVRGASISQSLQFASVAGAITATKYGAVPAIPSREQVASFPTESRK